MNQLVLSPQTKHKLQVILKLTVLAQHQNGCQLHYWV